MQRPVSAVRLHIFIFIETTESIGPKLPLMVPILSRIQ